MSDPDKTKKGAKTILENALRAPAVKNTYESVASDSHEFTDADGAPAIVSGEDLQNNLLKYSQLGWKGTVPLTDSSGRVVQVPLESIQHAAPGDVSTLQVLRGNAGVGNLYQKAREVVNEEVDNERDLATIGHNIANTVTAGQYEKTLGPNVHALHQIDNEVNSVSSLVGKGIGAVGVAAAGGAALEGAGLASESILGGLAGDVAIDAAINTNLTLADYAMQDKKVVGETFLQEIPTQTLLNLPILAGFRFASPVAKALRGAAKEEDAIKNTFTNAGKSVEEQAKYFDAHPMPDDPHDWVKLSDKQKAQVIDANGKMVDASLGADEAAGAWHTVAKGEAGKVEQSLAERRNWTIDMHKNMGEMEELLSPEVGKSVIKRGIEELPVNPEAASQVLARVRGIRDGLERAAVGGSTKDLQALRTAVGHVTEFEKHLASGVPTQKLINRIDTAADGVFDLLNTKSAGHITPDSPVYNAVASAENALRDMKFSPEILGAAAQPSKQIAEAAQAAIDLNKTWEHLNMARKGLPISRYEKLIAGKDMAEHMHTISSNLRKVDGYAEKLLASPSPIHQVHGQKLVAASNKIKAQIVSSGILPGTDGFARNLEVYRHLQRRAKEASQSGGSVVGNLGRAVAQYAAWHLGGPAGGLAAGAVLRNAGGQEAKQIGKYLINGDPAKVALFGAAHKAASRVYTNIAKGADAVAQAITLGRPVTARTAGVAVGMEAYRNYTSEKDKREDFTKLAKELSHVTSDPNYLVDRMGTGMGPFAALDRDAGQHMSDAAVRKAMYLADNFPKPTPSAFGKPDYSDVPMAEVDKALQMYHIADRPTDLMHEVAAGTIEPFMVQTVQEIFPSLYSEMRGAILDEVAKADLVPYNVQRAVSTFLGFPLDPVMGGQFTADLQDVGVALTAQQQREPQGNGNSGRPLGKSYITNTTRGTNF